jgi:hypothetical protein
MLKTGEQKQDLVAYLERKFMQGRFEHFITKGRSERFWTGFISKC